jgi:hypothetical protein
MYAVDHKPDPVRLHIDAPAGWHIVNGDSRVADQADYVFENYDRVADSPTEVSPPLILDTLRIDDRIYRAMVHHNGQVTTTERRRRGRAPRRSHHGGARVFPRLEHEARSRRRALPVRLHSRTVSAQSLGGEGWTQYYGQMGSRCISTDIVQAVSDAAGIDMHAWFDRYVGGTDDMDYDEVLAARRYEADSRCEQHRGLTRRAAHRLHGSANCDSRGMGQWQDV